jgi:spore maturation protein CgeB
MAKAGNFTAPAQWKASVSFVGNSMVYKVAQRMKVAKPSKPLLLAYKQIAAGFAAHPERSVNAYLAAHHSKLMPAYEQLDSMERRLAFETMITWEATRQYRASCLQPILEFNPLLVGDKGWRLTFPEAPSGVRLHAELSYYADLPFFYPLSDINFNCTSAQMKGAVNQRIFDVPAAGAFVLTDWREQMDDLFEPGKEVIFYRTPEEIPDLLNYYLARPEERQRIAAAARKRVLAEHTYAHRLQTIITRMREVYGSL